MQTFGHTKRMAENPIQFVWERPEIDHIALYPVPVALPVLHYRVLTRYPVYDTV